MDLNFLSDINNREVVKFDKHGWNTYKITFLSTMNDSSNGTLVEIYPSTPEIITDAKKWFIEKKGYGGISTMYNAKCKWQVWLTHVDGDDFFWSIGKTELEVIFKAYEFATKNKSPKPTIKNPKLEDVRKLEDGGLYWIKLENEENFTIGKLSLELHEEGETYIDLIDGDERELKDHYSFTLLGATWEAGENEYVEISELDTRKITRK